MSSMSYWNTASAVRDELVEIKVMADEMYSDLESNDDPGDLADDLADIEKRMAKLVAQIGPNVPALRKTAKALAEIPGVKA
jgi:hypothetical protein